MTEVLVKNFNKVVDQFIDGQLILWREDDPTKKIVIMYMCIF